MGFFLKSEFLYLKYSFSPMSPKCDVKTESINYLENHKRINHMMTNSMQTDEKLIEDKFQQFDKELEFLCEKDFQKYLCNYCGINIANDYHLNNHRRKCRGTFNMFDLPGLPPRATAMGMSPGFIPGFPPGPPWIWLQDDLIIFLRLIYTNKM